MQGNKKIGLFTFHRALNYGAVWQCWALKKACESFGYEVETIDYNPWGHYEAKWALKRSPYVAYKYLKQLWQFNRFVAKRLNPTVHTESHEWIKQNPPLDDIYIVGSDQVWANEIVGERLDSYLMDYAPQNVKRIAYAASTGGNPMKVTEYQLGELQKFAAISVRERQSVNDVQAKVKVPVADVCDPSMLLTPADYQAMEQKLLWLPKHYVVCFNLAGDSFCEESAKLIGKSMSLPVVNMVGKYKSWANRNYPAPTPEQWLYLIHHADYVVTNSFHGVALSIVYRRPFVFCAPQKGGRAKNNYRIQNLLEQTKQRERYITDVIQLENLLYRGATFDESVIETYRIRSLEWLKNAIENETSKE